MGADGARVAFLRSAAGTTRSTGCGCWSWPRGRAAGRRPGPPARRRPRRPAARGAGPAERAQARRRHRRLRRRPRPDGGQLRPGRPAVRGRPARPGGVRELPAGEGRSTRGSTRPAPGSPGWPTAPSMSPPSRRAGGRRGGRPRARTTEVSWGLAEFVAAEEMGRARVLVGPGRGAAGRGRGRPGPVRRFHLADPDQPGDRARPAPLPGRRHRQRRGEPARGRPGRPPGRGALGPGRPVPGVGPLGGRRPPHPAGQSRDQTATLVLAADPGTGATTTWPPSATRPGSTSSAACRRGWTAGWS